MSYLTVILLGYLCGSVPTAYWFCLAVYRIDIFQHGSRNMGATNVHRVLGSLPFAVTLCIDILKGMAPVLLAVRFAPDPASLVPHQLAAGLAAVAGHTLSFWVRFKGGKGVATGLGVFLALAPRSSILAMGIFLAVLVISGFVSLGSMVSAVSLPAMIYFFREGGEDWYRILTLFAGAIAGFILVKHRANIGRLWRGEELSLRQARPGGTPPTPDPADQDS